MKAWCTLNNAPTLLSRILYIDLTNAKGEVVMKKMYLLDSLSSSPANFTIPQTLPTGTYSLNSYTLWMKNFPQSNFSKSIVVYGLEYDSVNNKQQQKVEKLSLKFFPEGGNLITGVANRVAFKATNSTNLPENLEGYIADETDKKIVDISSVHDGMGFFELVPEAGKNYIAYIKKGSLISYSYPLPASQTAGVSLKVENSNSNKIFVLIKRGSNTPSNVNVIAQINNSIVLKAKINLTNSESALAINKKDLPGGIIQITVFDESNNPIAERISFVENYELKKASVTNRTINFNKKGLNVLDVSMPTGDKSFSGSCIVTSFVSDDDKSTTNIENIASALYLTADVKGYIHNPGYYFKDKSPETLKNLDLLLMTQGWRRFEWQKILREEMPVLKYPVETSIAYKGRVFKTGSTKQPVQDGFISFIFRKNNKTEMIADSKIDSNGYFVLNNVNFYDTANLSYMATNNKKVKFVTNVTMQPNYIDTLRFSHTKPEVTLHFKPFDSKDPFTTEWMRSSNIKERVLERVIVKGTRTKEDILNDKYATGEFNKRPGIIIDPRDFRQGKSFADMLQVSVPGIRVDKSENFFEPNIGYGSQALKYSINERHANAKDVYNIDEDQIAMIKFYGNVLFDIPLDMYPAVRPHLAIYTKDKDRPFIAVHEKRYISQDVLGYAVNKRYYEPDYENMRQQNSVEDNRYTLYWNPNIKSSRDGKLSIKFYNNDFDKKYKIIIQGITSDGEVIYLQQVVE